MSHPSSFAILALAVLSIGTTAGWTAPTVPADRPPTILTAVQPIRPRPVLSFGTAGEVEVAFTINADGSVEQMRIHRSTDTLLEAPVLAAIKQWKFSPAIRNGQAVAVQARQVFSFDAPYTKPSPPRDLPPAKSEDRALVATAK